MRWIVHGGRRNRVEEEWRSTVKGKDSGGCGEKKY